ncbi:MAG: zf-HC2 domain-containing protein [Acidobacteria bacterium]|jgi:anti-sigma factor RsiW|nr:zf-HC2 domain-containing protein [Acidobacteriota bacterium]
MMTAEVHVTCDTLLEQISSYLDDELPDATCAAIEQHAASCPVCGRILTDFRTTTGLCRTAANVPLPDDVRIRARDRVRELLGGRVCFPQKR